MRKISFCFILFFSTLLVSCSFLVNEKQPKQTEILHTITGKAKIEERYAINDANFHANSRNAFPTYNSSNFHYDFFATKNDSSGSPLDSKNYSSSENKFSIALSSGTWTIGCNVYSGENSVFQGNTTIVLTDENPTEQNITIPLSPYIGGDAKGTANLAIYTEVQEIVSGVANWKNITTNETGSQNLDFTKTDSSGNHCDFFTFDGNSVQAGVYNVTFSFYAEVNASRLLVCSTTKTVNIANSLVTDTWSDDGGFIQHKKFTLTQQRILISKAEQLYVDGSALTNGSGLSQENPLDSLDDAFSLVKGFGLNGKILIRKGTTVAFTKDFVLSENVKTLDVNSYSLNADADVKPTIQRNSDVQISDGGTSDSSITLTNINLEDGASYSAQKAYISLSAGKLRISECSIKSNQGIDVSNANLISHPSITSYDTIYTGINGKSLDESIGIKIRGNSVLTMFNGSFTNYHTGISFALGSLPIGIEIISITGTNFSGNSTGISAHDFTTLSLKDVTLQSNDEFGLETNKNVTLSGTCALDDTFKLSSDVLINFDSNYQGAAGNSVFVQLNSDSDYVRGKQVLSGANISTHYLQFTAQKDGWAINSKGCLYKTNVASEISQYYYVDPINGDDANARDGSFDYAYKTVQGAVNAINVANSASGGKNYTIYLLNDCVANSSSTFNNSSFVNIESNSVLNLTIDSFDEGKVYKIDAGGSSLSLGRCLNINTQTASTITLNNIQIQGGYSTTLYGGGICISGGTAEKPTLILDGDTIVGNEISVQAGTKATDDLMTKSAFGNSARQGGGIYVSNANLTMSGNSCVAHNSSQNGGSGVYISDANSTFTVGSATNHAPAIYGNYINANDTQGSVRSCGKVDFYGTHHHNYSANGSAAFEIAQSGSLYVYEGSSIHDNYSKNGGGAIHVSVNSVNRTKIYVYGGSFSNNHGENSDNYEITFYSTSADSRLYIEPSKITFDDYDSAIFVGNNAHIYAFSSFEPAGNIYTIKLDSYTDGNIVLKGSDLPNETYEITQNDLNYVKAIIGADTMKHNLRLDSPNSAIIDKNTSSGGGTTNPFDNTTTFHASENSGSSLDSLDYGTEHTITITATATSGKAISWDSITVSYFGGNVPAEYYTPTRTNGTESASGPSSATSTVTFQNTMPPGTYYINVNATVSGITYSDTITATIVK